VPQGEREELVKGADEDAKTHFLEKVKTRVLTKVPPI